MKDEGGRMKPSPKQDRALLRQSAALRSRPLFSFILHPSSFILLIALLSTFIELRSSRAQTRQQPGAHSTVSRDSFTAADRRLVEKAIGTTCAERVRDPLGSTPIDEMQARPSLPVNNPEAVAGARRAESLLPTTRTLVSNAIVKLAKEYDLYGTAVARARISAATQRVEAVRRIKPDVDARDNASVVLREPRTIEFGTIFLAGLRSDEAMISVLAHELTHIASGQPDSLRPLFRAIGRRAGVRTGLRIQGQRAEELACDLIGVMAARQFISQTPSWEPLPRRLTRAFEHNCVDDDASDEDHLSPRNTIRALLALDVTIAGEVVADTVGATQPVRTPPACYAASVSEPIACL
jgi:Zn-dependent protease with chaperone function